MSRHMASDHCAAAALQIKLPNSNSDAITAFAAAGLHGMSEYLWPKYSESKEPMRQRVTHGKPVQPSTVSVPVAVFTHILNGAQT